MTGQSKSSREAALSLRNAPEVPGKRDDFENLPRTGSDTDETLTVGPQPTSPSKDERIVETEANTEFVTGVKLMALLVTVTLVVFLLLLDLSIISTVSAMQTQSLLKSQASES